MGLGLREFFTKVEAIVGSIGMVIIIAHRISHKTNVVVVSIQSNSSKKILLFADWLFTTTFILWDILWALLIAPAE